MSPASILQEILITPAAVGIKSRFINEKSADCSLCLVRCMAATPAVCTGNCSGKCHPGIDITHELFDQEFC